MNYQIVKKAGLFDGYEVRMVGEFYPYECLGNKYIGHLATAEPYMSTDFWHYVPVVGEIQLPGVYVTEDKIDEFIQHIARLNAEQSARDLNAATEAAEWEAQNRRFEADPGQDALEEMNVVSAYPPEISEAHD